MEKYGIELTPVNLQCTILQIGYLISFFGELVAGVDKSDVADTHSLNGLIFMV